MLLPFERGSSSVDWCEGNYLVSPIIAEFANTITNIYSIVFPPILIYLFQPYAHHVTRGIYLVWSLLIIVGFASAYFHATLSFVGQILDELSILWVLLTGFALFAPPVILPNVFIEDRKLLSRVITVFGMITTGLAFIQPFINAFVLMIFGMVIAITLAVEVRRSKNTRVIKLGYSATMFWTSGVICWLNDRLLCDMWSSAFNFQYFHAFFHILVFQASYLACVLYAFFHAQLYFSDKQPELLFWPCDKFEYGIPYIKFTVHSNCPNKHKNV